MSQKNKRRFAAVMAAILAFALLCSLILSLIGSAIAAPPTSQEIAEEHYETELEAQEYARQAAELEQQAADLQRRAQEAVQNKLLIDTAILELETDIDGIKSEIQHLNLDIAAKQSELDNVIAEEAAMTERFKTRMRAMEEGGTQNYWAVIFRASSLSDLLDQLAMIADISKADQKMQSELVAVRLQVIEEQEALEVSRAERSEKQAELEEKQVLLNEKRAEMDQAILNLCADNDLMLAAKAEAEAIEAELREKSLQLLKEYNEAVKKEQAAAAAAKRNAASGSSGASSSGFMLPVPSGCASVTDAYGNRWHPIKKVYSFHTGVDLACGAGTSIYATKSGTIVECKFNSTYGNYITIQHSDGSASMYAHMSSTAVKSGDYVSQGSVIGYVGSTGISTGPHLHFEIYIGGCTVNPMDYVSLW